jgi:hypothetical protein
MKKALNMTILKSTLVIALSLSIFDPGITQESKYTGQKPSNSKSEPGSAQDVFCQNLMAHNPGKSDNQPANAYKSTRLSLELVKTEPVPVIGSQHSDAQDIPAGFEAGTTLFPINSSTRGTICIPASSPPMTNRVNLRALARQHSK